MTEYIRLFVKDLMTGASITSKIAFGPNAGKSVTKIGSGLGLSPDSYQLAIAGF